MFPWFLSKSGQGDLNACNQPDLSLLFVQVAAAGEYLKIGFCPGFFESQGCIP